ncbi:amino acid permease [Haloferacaceae archaeon DSL9]
MSDQELARDLGFLEAYTLGLGTMIGAGIFVLPGIVAGAAGPASMVSFVIGGVIALLAALSLSELATGMPKAGGSYYYVNRALGPLFGSIVGWGMWAGLMFATAFYMLGFGQYLTGLHPDAPVVLSAMLMAVLLVLVNYRGVKETGALQNIIVILLVGLIIVFIAFGLFSIDRELLSPFTPEGWGAVALTAGTVFVTFIGFEVIATSAEEIKDPGRNLPLSMIAAVATPTLLYVLVMLVSTGVLPVTVLEDSEIPVAIVAEAALDTFGVLSLGFVDISLGQVGSVGMIIGAILATVSSANASILSAARVNFAMGRDRILTDWLNRIHDRFRTPYRAIVATGIIILLLIGSGLPIDTLADVASFSYLATYALVHIAVIVMRRADPEDYDPSFRIPRKLYPVVPIGGSLGCLAVMVQMRPVVQGIGVVIILIGVLWYGLYARERARSESLIGEAIAPVPSNAADETELYRVVVPVANPATEQALIQYAAAGAAGRSQETELLVVNVTEVPPQTSLEQGVLYEEERLERQQQLFGAARETAEKLNLTLRTRAIVGRDAAQVLLEVAEEEHADHILLGWGGTRTRKEIVLGSTIDPILERAPCEVTLVRNPDTSIQSIVTLAGRGPNAPFSARRAAELSRTLGIPLTLLNVQQKGSTAGEDTSTDPKQVGIEIIEEVAKDARLTSEEYTAKVIVSDDVEAALLESVTEYDAVCIGATGSTFVAHALYGTLPQRIVRVTDNTIVMARGQSRSPQTLREAIIYRLGGRPT